MLTCKYGERETPCLKNVVANENNPKIMGRSILGLNTCVCAIEKRPIEMQDWNLLCL